ncbi:MAG: hypothetical protein ACO3LF_06020 [Candidatus Kariarchaeum pelagius]
MLSFNGKDSYFIPNVHKNAVGTYNLKELPIDDFTICARIKPNWEKCGENHFDSYGVICLNGMDMGICIRKDVSGNYNLNAEFWVNNRNPEVKLVQLVSGTDFQIDDDWLDISFIYKKNQSVILRCGTSVSSIDCGDDLVDYSQAWLWVGCANNRWNVDGALWRNYSGQIKSIGVFGKALHRGEINKFFNDYDKEFNESTKPFFIMSEFKRTRYKVFDESYNGNHLCKNIYNTDGRNLMF